VEICHAFARIGHDVTLIVPATAENEQVTDAEIYRIYGVEGNFSIERVSDPLGSNEKRLWSWQAAGAAKRMEPDICYSRDLYASVFSCFLKIRTVHEFHHFKKDSEAQTILTRMRKRLSAISKGLSIFWSRRFEEYTGSSISSVLGFIRAGGYSQSTRMMEKLFLSGNCVRIVAIT
jgi:hypothetical protein